MSHQQTWTERIKAVVSTAELTMPEPLVRTLEDFRVALNEGPSIRAELRTGSHPRMRTLVVYPKYRRDISAVVLTFWVDRDAVRVTGPTGEVFADKDKLEAYLADFAEKSAFPSTVAEFRQLQEENVHGVLRVAGLFEDSPTDVPVLVEAADHNRLAKRALEDDVATQEAVGVVIEDRPSMGTFDPSTIYLFLESGGFGLRIGTPRQEGKTLRLFGSVVPLQDLTN